MTETREEDAEGRGGKKREQGGRSFREDSHAHHYFNIRPHVGDDRQQQSVHNGVLISIHVPTWGMTSRRYDFRYTRYFNPRPYMRDDVPFAVVGCVGLISIHVPTWGTT